MPKSLKILAFAAYYHPFRGGYIESIHEWAKRLVAKGHHITIVTCKVTDSPEEEVMEGVRIIRLPAWHWLNGTYPILKAGRKTRAILKKLSQEHYDLVSTHTRFFITSFLGAHWARRHNIPHIHTERGATHSVVEKKWIGWAGRIIDHTLGRYIVRTAKLNAGVSEAACSFLKHLGAKETVCLYNGVEPIKPLSPSRRKEQRQKHHFGEKDKVLLFVGRLIYAKGVQDVLSILPQLTKRHLTLKFVILGDGPYRKVLENLTLELGLKKYVRFVGEKPLPKVMEWLQIADYMVNPSYSEGLPRSVLEGAAGSLPIVATDTGGTKEIIEDGVSGRLVTPQNLPMLEQALRELMDHPHRAQQYGQAARAKIEKKFLWNNLVEEYINIAYGKTR